MIESIIFFIAGYLCGRYTEQIKEFFSKIINKFKKQEDKIINE